MISHKTESRQGLRGHAVCCVILLGWAASLVASASAMADDESARRTKQLKEDLQAMQSRCQTWSMDCIVHVYDHPRLNSPKEIDDQLQRLLESGFGSMQLRESTAYRVARDQAMFRVDHEALSGSNLEQVFAAFDGQILRSRYPGVASVNQSDFASFEDAMPYPLDPVAENPLGFITSHWCDNIFHEHIADDGKVSEELIDGLACYRIDLVSEFSSGKTIWLAKDRDLIPVRFLEQQSDDGSVRLQVTGFHKVATTNNVVQWLPKGYVEIKQNTSSCLASRIEIEPAQRHRNGNTFRVINQRQPPLLAKQLKRNNAGVGPPMATPGVLPATSSLPVKRHWLSSIIQRHAYTTTACVLPLIFIAMLWVRGRNHKTKLKQSGSEPDVDDAKKSSRFVVLGRLISVAPFGLAFAWLCWRVLAVMPATFQTMTVSMAAIAALITVYIANRKQQPELLRRLLFNQVHYFTLVSLAWCCFQPSLSGILSLILLGAMSIWLLKRKPIAMTVPKFLKHPRFGRRRLWAIAGVVLSMLVYGGCCTVESWWEKSVALGMAGLFGLLWIVVMFAFVRRFSLMSLLCLCLCFAALMASYRGAADQILQRKRTIDVVTSLGGTIRFRGGYRDRSWWIRTPEGLWIPRTIAGQIGNAAIYSVTGIDLPVDSFTPENVRRWNFDDLTSITLRPAVDQSSSHSISAAVQAIPSSAKLGIFYAEPGVIDDEGLRTLTRMGSLRHLGVNLDGESPTDVITKFPHLKSFGLQNARLGVKECKLLGNLPDLNVLCFEETTFIDKNIPINFSSSAEACVISKSTVSAPWMAWCSSVCESYMTLVQCKLSPECYSDAENVFKYTSHLEFRSMNVTVTQLEQLAKVKSMKSLHLNATGIKEKQVEAFSAMRPDVTVRW